jgi:hypothetical protein
MMDFLVRMMIVRNKEKLPFKRLKRALKTYHFQTRSRLLLSIRDTKLSEKSKRKCKLLSEKLRRSTLSLTNQF